MDDIPSRVAVLEQIARNTLEALTGIRADIHGLRADLHSEIGGLRGELQSSIGGLRGELQASIGGLRGELQALRADQRSDFRFLVRLYIGGFVATVAGYAALLAVMAHGFKWI